MGKEITILDEVCKKDKCANNRNQTIRKHFSKDEVNELLNKLPPNRDLILFHFLWKTGCRISEALNVQKNDISFENNEITIKWLKNRAYEYRVIPLHKTLKNMLYIYVGQLKWNEKLFGFSRQYVYQLCQKYGFGHPHKLRHSFAINFLRQSDSPMGLVELMYLLGHARIDSTMEYLKIVPSQQKKALDRIEFD